MKSKILYRILIVIAVIAVTVFVFRGAISERLMDYVTADMFVAQDTDEFEPGVPVGESFPAIRALYGGTEISSIEGFAGANGTVFFAARSVDWCPFCRKQLGELQAHVDAFAQAGIGLVAMTYDSPELQQAFIDAGQITYPFLSDIDADSFNRLGIINEEYAPGDTNYGIPHPGVFILDPQQRIVGKIFVESYAERVDGRNTLAYAQQVLQN